MVQIVLQPTFGALVVKLPSARKKEQQIVPEHTTRLSQIHKNKCLNEPNEGGCAKPGCINMETALISVYQCSWKINKMANPETTTGKVTLDLHKN